MTDNPFAPPPESTPQSTSLEVPPALTPPMPVAAPKTNGSATIAFVLSLFGIVPLVGVIAIVLGRYARSRIVRTGEGGFAVASAAIWIGWVSTALWILVFVFMTSATIGGLSSV